MPYLKALQSPANSRLAYQVPIMLPLSYHIYDAAPQRQVRPIHPATMYYQPTRFFSHFSRFSPRHNKELTKTPRRGEPVFHLATPSIPGTACIVGVIKVPPIPCWHTTVGRIAIGVASRVLLSSIVVRAILHQRSRIQTSCAHMCSSDRGSARFSAGELRIIRLLSVGRHGDSQQNAETMRFH